MRVESVAMTVEWTRREAQRRIALPTAVITAMTAVLAWRGWIALREIGPLHAIKAGQVQLAGPVVAGFVAVVFLIEQRAPAERRPVNARGHLLDLAYFIAHAALVVPVIVLIGAGFSSSLAKAAPWLVLPRVDAVPGWLFVVLALVAIDAVDWLAHLANHKIASLWRLHAVHHSQEELSILSTFRTHPLVHVTFVFSAVPILALAANAATPATLLTAYACLGALPHANVRWTYGAIGRFVISPSFHRRHHSPTERLDVNLGTVLTVWDRMTKRAVFPDPTAAVAPTGLAGRPIPVEQGAPQVRLTHTLISQITQPFLSPSGASR
jgi:sterol desaturase/sphingolipid hydroxylase (fatty acid hydroxylase superfamily)